MRVALVASLFWQNVLAIEAAVVTIVAGRRACEASTASIHSGVAFPTGSAAVQHRNDLALHLDLAKGSILEDLSMDRRRPWKQK